MNEPAPVHTGDTLDWLHEQGKRRSEAFPGFDVEETLRKVRAAGQHHSTEQDPDKPGAPSNSQHDTRDEVARLILALGPSTAATLADRLGLTPAAIRRHLDNLIAEGLVETRTARTYGNRGRGRPAKVFVINDAGRTVMEQGTGDLPASAVRLMIEQIQRQIAQDAQLQPSQSGADDPDDRLFETALTLVDSLQPTKNVGASVAALDWSLTAMSEAAGVLAQARTLDPGHAAVAVSDATWWVTIVDATLSRYYPGSYDAAMDAQPPKQRTEIELTMAGLRYVRNQMGIHRDPAEFTTEQGSSLTWRTLPPPPPGGQEWEHGRYRAYQERLAGHSVIRTFALAARFLRLAAASRFIQPETKKASQETG